jgi:hypothetical protein
MLSKQALDALKARTMAKSLGLIPHPGSQWKWALRNMRDGQGNPLEGKALAETKEDMGKMPNNVRQKLQSVSRATGHRMEIGTFLKNDPEWEQSLNQHQLNLRSEGDFYRQSNNRTGSFKSITAARPPQKQGFLSRLFGNNSTKASIEPEINKPKIYPGIAKLKNTRRGPFFIGDEAGVGTKFERMLDDPKNKVSIHTHPFYSAHQFSSIPELRRTGFNGPSLVSPSGDPKNFKQEIEDYLAADKENTLDDIKLYGDYSAFSQLPHMTHNIYDPNFGNEGVHKARPQGMRSIYFQNQANEAPLGLAKLAEEFIGTQRSQRMV